MNFFTKSSWPAGSVALLLTGTALAQEPAHLEAEGDDDTHATEDGSDVLAGSPAAFSEALSFCVASHENAQLARLSGGFLEAMNHLARCSDPGCPAAVRDDCMEWRNELRFLIPSVLIVVRGPTGDVDDAKVSIDGHLVRERLDGRGVALDPGKHLIRVESAEGQVQERSLVLTEGEGTRRLVFEFENGLSLPPETAPLSPPDTARPVPPLAYVLGGTAVVSLGFAVGFGTHALKMSKQANDTCAPLCDPSVSRAVTERAVVADIALGVSVLSVVGAVLVYAYRPEVTVAKEKVLLDLRAGRDGGRLLMGGQF